jgi:hypothetical protein
MKLSRLNLLLAAGGVCTAMLAGCGGGGGGDDSSTPVTTAPVVTTPAALSISGTAAKGDAIASGSVSVKCAAGAATSATTAADGSYSVSVTSGALPCVLQVTSADSAITLYSVAAGSGSSATANITPLTQLVVASLTGTDPAAYFTSFDSTAANAVTSTAVASAQTAVVTTLAAAGIDVSASAVGDLLTGTLTAKSSTTTTGNAYDVALDTLAATLSSTGTTLATLTTTVAATSAASTGSTSTSTSTTTSGTPSLPADMLLKAAASNCSALRSGTYRMVLPGSGTALADQQGTIVIDAATLAITYTDGSPGAWAAHATEACHFTDDAGKTDIVVSPAGVLVVRHTEDSGSTYHLGIGFPEQTHTLAELAGTWNIIGVDTNSTGSYTGIAATATLDSAGALSNATECRNDSTWSVTGTDCAAVTSGLPSLAVNSAGGFDVNDAGSTGNGRAFVYRAGGGELLMVTVDADGSFQVYSKQRSNELPANGRVRTTWDMRVTNQLLATPSIGESTNTVTAVDSAASSFTRLAKTVGGTDEHVETVLVNSPRNGYNFRAAATVTGTDGTTVVNVTEWTNLDLRGMGLNALLRPAQKQFMFSVQQP